MSAAATSPGAACVLLRIWLPDRPGALGAVASRIGAVRGNVRAIEVLERQVDRALDEFVIDLPDDALVGLVVVEVEQVDGVEVAEVGAAPQHVPDARLD